MRSAEQIMSEWRAEQPRSETLTQHECIELLKNAQREAFNEGYGQAVGIYSMATGVTLKTEPCMASSIKPYNYDKLSNLQRDGEGEKPY